MSYVEELPTSSKSANLVEEAFVKILFLAILFLIPQVGNSLPPIDDFTIPDWRPDTSRIYRYQSGESAARHVLEQCQKERGELSARVKRLQQVIRNLTEEE